jgi:hypothetical protein
MYVDLCFATVYLVETCLVGMLFNILRVKVKHVGFQVLTAVSMKIAIFWVVAPCSLVEVYRRFRGAGHRPHDGGSKHL